MADETKFTEKEAHAHFARRLNGKVWELLEKKERSSDEDELLEYTAYASGYHWLFAGTPVNHQRFEWLLARVNIVLSRPDAALRHAKRCAALTVEHAALMKDFDRAYANEGLARAYALVGDHAQSQRYFGLAQAAGEEIRDEEDQEIFLGDLRAPPWFDVR